MKISKIHEATNLNNIYQVLSSREISDNKKISYLRQNKSKIISIIKKEITSSEFKMIMQNRPLLKFRPIKNSITKRTDKKLLAMALEIDHLHVDNYINDFCEKLFMTNSFSDVEKENFEIIKTYIYRHGKKEQVIKILDYELTYVKNKLELLYKTLSYNMNGVADYFRRPIHKMDNRTMVKMYEVVDKHLSELENNGIISSNEKEINAKWALATIYNIQNNSRLLNAIKIYKTLK